MDNDKIDKSMNTTKDTYAKCFKKYKEDPESAKHIIRDVESPYNFFIYCLKCNNTSKNRVNLLKLLVAIKELKESDQDGDKKEELKYEIQLEVSDLIMRYDKIMNKKLISEVYELHTIDSTIFPKVQRLLQNHQYKDACNLIILYKLYSNFSTEDILLPLLFLKLENLIETFLDNSTNHRLPFIKYLDQLIGDEISESDLIEKYKINIKKKNRHSKKTLCSLCVRFLKKYNLDAKHISNTIHMQFSGAVHYLFLQYYRYHSLTKTAFLDLIGDIVQSDRKITASVLDFFEHNNDTWTALSFIKQYEIEEKDIPSSILDYIEENNIDMNTILDDEMNNKSDDNIKNDCYELKVPKEKLYFVSNIDQYREFVDALNKSDVIGIDSEWKPNFSSLNLQEKPALVQVAMSSGVFLLDTPSLTLSSEEWSHFANIFSNPAKSKLFYDFTCDKDCLGKLDESFLNKSKDFKNIIDLHKVKMNIVNSDTKYFDYSDSKDKGLSELVYFCFGYHLDKSEQLSLWTKRPLSSAQITYGALDAQCLLDIYYYLDQKMSENQLPDWRTIKASKKDPKKSPPKKQKNSVTENGQAAKSSNEIKIVCDTMVQGLTKLLRHCGIDTVTLDNDEDHDKCIEYFEKEGRIVLTRGSPYDRLIKFIPPTHIYQVQADTSKHQLKEIVQNLKIVIYPNDVFSRCPMCNAKSFITVSSSILKKVQDRIYSNQDNEQGKIHWLKFNEGKIDATNGKTGKGADIDFDGIPEHMYKRVKVFYLCNGCGKVYWDGSHYNRVWNTLDGLIANEDNRNYKGNASTSKS